MRRITYAALLTHLGLGLECQDHSCIFDGMQYFGQHPDGTTVSSIVLASDRLSISLLTLGARLNSVHLDGGPNLTHGITDVAEGFGKAQYSGPIIGPIINRIGGAAATLDGVALGFEANQAGRHSLHSGAAGTHILNWQIEQSDETRAVMTTRLPNGAGGLPGNRHLTVEWWLEDAALNLAITARTDQPTFLNLGHHGYWNLDASAAWTGHLLQVDADRYTPTDGDTVPTGEIRTVDNSIYDLRSPVAPSDLLDTNFCLNGGLGPAARLQGASGRWMEIWTDAPGLQVYSGNAGALALEPQIWPDAPNHSAFPSIRYDADTPFRQSARYVFGTD